jgi:hypothetical protein
MPRYQNDGALLAVPYDLALMTFEAYLGREHEAYHDQNGLLVKDYDPSVYHVARIFNLRPGSELLISHVVALTIEELKHIAQIMESPHVDDAI